MWGHVAAKARPKLTEMLFWDLKRAEFTNVWTEATLWGRAELPLQRCERLMKKTIPLLLLNEVRQLYIFNCFLLNSESVTKDKRWHHPADHKTQHTNVILAGLQFPVCTAVTEHQSGGWPEAEAWFQRCVSEAEQRWKGCFFLCSRWCALAPPGQASWS